MSIFSNSSIKDWVRNSYNSWTSPGENNSSSVIETDDVLPTNILGKTGKTVTNLTLGGGHFRKRFMTPDESYEIVERAFQLGIRSFESANEYEESQEYMGEALKAVRDEIFLASKVDKASYKDARNQLEKNLNTMQTNYLDVVSIHCFGYEPLYPDAQKALSKDGILGALIDAKEEGLIGSIGVTGHHNPARYKQVLERDEIEVYMCAVNFVVRFMYNFEEKVFESARKKNCGLIAMKVLGGPSNWKEGKAPLTGEHYQNAINYALFQPGIHTISIGVRKMEELEQAVQAVKSYKPFTDEEYQQLLAFGKGWADEHKRLYHAGFYGNPMD